MKRKNLYFLSLSIILMLSFVLLSSEVALSVKNALKICAFCVVPSLFIFFIVSSFIVEISCSFNFKIKFLAFILSFICGFPIGVSLICNYYEKGMIDKKTANKMLMFTNNASPAFLINIVGIHTFKSVKIGYLIIFCQILTSLFVAYLFNFSFKEELKAPKKDVSIVKTVVLSIKNSVLNMLFVCGFVIFFCVVGDIFLKVLSNFNRLKLFLSGFIEMIGFCSKFVVKNEIDAFFTVAIVGFSGICVILQCMLFIKKAMLDFKYLICGKIIYALIMPLIFRVLLYKDFYCLIILILISLTKEIKKYIINRNKKGEQTNDFFKGHYANVSLLRKR